MIILLGGRGYIGSAFARRLDELDLEYQTVSRANVDYTDRATLMGLIKQSRATFLINAAGYAGRPNVDACEIHKAECLSANAVLPGIVREACEACQLPWGHISSGCIYSGTRPDGTGFREIDPPNFCFRNGPCSFYSGCKALGEECLEGAESVYVWRLRIPFNRLDSQRNYLSKLMRYERLLDVTNSITHLNEFVDACLQCWIRRVPCGVYNMTNPGHVDTREVVAIIQRELQPDREFRYFSDESEFMQCAATAPRSSCVLDNTKLLQTGIEMSDVRDAIRQSLREWVPKRP